MEKTRVHREREGGGATGMTETHICTETGGGGESSLREEVSLLRRRFITLRRRSIVAPLGIYGLSLFGRPSQSARQELAGEFAPQRGCMAS